MSFTLMRATVASFAACCFFFADNASSAPTGVDPAVHAKADTLFRAGRAAAEAGDNKTACDRFRESEELEPAPGTQLNLGACEEAMGHILAAREHFRLAIAAFKPDDKRRPLATTRAGELSRRLGRLTVHVAPDAPPDIRVTVGGAPLDVKILEHGIEVDPGKTALVTTATGRLPRSYDVDLGEGQTRDVVVGAGDPAGGAALPPPVEAPTSSTKSASANGPSRQLLRTLGFVGAGVGGVGILTGSIFGGLAFHEASVVKSNCNASLACQPPGVSAASSGKTDSVVSTTGFIVGGVFAAAGAYLVITTWKTNDGAPPADKPASALTLTPMLFYSGAGVTAASTF